MEDQDYDGMSGVVKTKSIGGGSLLSGRDWSDWETVRCICGAFSLVEQGDREVELLKGQ